MLYEKKRRVLSCLDAEQCRQTLFVLPSPGVGTGWFFCRGGDVVQDGTVESWESSTIALRTGTRVEKGLGVSSWGFCLCINQRNV